MRTLYPVLLVIAIGVAVTTVNMSGFAAVIGNDPAENLESGETLEEQVQESSLNDSEPFEGPAGQSDDGDIIGIIIEGGRAIMRFAGAVILLPFELRKLGAPWYAAYPAGLGLQAVAAIGLIQFWTGRRWV